jgi:hypothetical protein
MSNVAQSETAFPVLEALARRIAADYALAERLVARARRSGLNAAALAEGHDLKDVPLLTAVAHRRCLRRGSGPPSQPRRRPAPAGLRISPTLRNQAP